MKSAAIRGSARDVITDERIAVGLDLMGASVPTMLQLLYPSLYAVHDPQGDWGKPQSNGRQAPTPPLCRCESDAWTISKERVAK